MLCNHNYVSGCLWNVDLINSVTFTITITLDFSRIYLFNIF